MPLGNEAGEEIPTIQTLLRAIKDLQEEVKKQRIQEAGEREADLAALKAELRSEILQISRELKAVKSQASMMGASSFVQKVFEETDQQSPSTPGPTRATAEPALPPCGIMMDPMAQSTPPAPLCAETGRRQHPVGMNSANTTTGTSNPPAARPNVLPTEYDGRTPWARYALQFEAVSKANGWTPSMQATYLATCLRGTALDYYETLDAITREDYNRLYNAFRSRFGVDHHQTVAHIQLRSRAQRGGESLAEFATDVQRLTFLTFSNCPEDARDKIALEQFLDGIADVDIQERVRDSAPPTLQIALQTAIRIEASHRATRAARRNIRAAIAQTFPRSNRRSSRPTSQPQENVRREEVQQESGNGPELA